MKLRRALTAGAYGWAAFAAGYWTAWHRPFGGLYFRDAAVRACQQIGDTR